MTQNGCGAKRRERKVNITIDCCALQMQHALPNSQWKTYYPWLIAKNRLYGFLICLDIKSAHETTSGVHCFLAWVNTMVIEGNFKALRVRFMRGYVSRYIAEW